MTSMTDRNPLHGSGVTLSKWATSPVKSGFRLHTAAGDVDLSDRATLAVDRLLSAPPELAALIEDLLECGAGYEDQQTMTPAEAAVVLGVSRPTVVRWVNEGLLSDQMVGAHHRLLRSEVTALVASRRQQAETNRERAQRARAELSEDGVDLGTAPTHDELVAAGRALRSGDGSKARSVMHRQRLQDARQASEAAANPATAP